MSPHYVLISETRHFYKASHCFLVVVLLYSFLQFLEYRDYIPIEYRSQTNFMIDRQTGKDVTTWE